MKWFKERAKWKETLYRREEAASLEDGVKGDSPHEDAPVKANHDEDDKDASLGQNEPGPGMVSCNDCGHYFPKAEMRQMTQRVSIVDFSVRSGDGQPKNLGPSSEMASCYCVPCYRARYNKYKPGHVPITEEAILGAMPERNYVKISYVIKALGITDIGEARDLEIKLKALVQEGKIEREMQEGKSYYMKRG